MESSNVVSTQMVGGVPTRTPGANLERVVTTVVVAAERMVTAIVIAAHEVATIVTAHQFGFERACSGRAADGKECGDRDTRENDDNERAS